MACASPVAIYIRSQNRTIEVPCGNCCNCRAQKVSYLNFLATRELASCYKDGLQSSFVTLTYAPQYLPQNCTSDGVYATLRKKDLQDFFKRLRSNYFYKYNEKLPLRYIACGEYGDTFGRPHYHVLFFGLSDRAVSALLLGQKLLKSGRKKKVRAWSFGEIQIKPLLSGGIRYVLKYLNKSPTGKLKKQLYVHTEPPFLLHSLRLGYKGADYTDTFTYRQNGVELPVPYQLRQRFDHNKTFNKNIFVQKLQDDALRLGFRDWRAYARKIAEESNAQKIVKLRQSGQPVFDTTSTFVNISTIKEVKNSDSTAPPKIVNSGESKNC